MVKKALAKFHAWIWVGLGLWYNLKLCHLQSISFGLIVSFQDVEERNLKTTVPSAVLYS